MLVLLANLRILVPEANIALGWTAANNAMQPTNRQRVSALPCRC